MPKNVPDELRDLLRDQVQVVSKEAIDSGGQLPADRVDTLARLARLVEIDRASQQDARRRRWPAVAAFGLTLLITSILLFARVTETEVELEVLVSQVSFVSPSQQVLADRLELSSLGVSGLDEIEVPKAPEGNVQVYDAASPGELGLRLSVDSGGQRHGSISLGTIVLPPEEHVWLRQSGSPSQYRLSLKGNPSEFRADFMSPVELGLSGGGTERLDFAAPQFVLLKSGADEVDFDLAFPGSSKSAFSTQLSAKDVSLFEIDETVDLDRTVVRRVSSIQSGSLFFASLNDQERKLRSGEVIDFEQSRGEFRTLRLQDDHIELKFHGRVRGMTTGGGEHRRSLMPTWLEWLQARHSLSLLWGTAIYLFGLVTLGLRWFGRSV